MSFLKNNTEVRLEAHGRYKAFASLNGGSEATGLVSLLDWDTRFFGFACARIENISAQGDNPTRLDLYRAVASQLLDWCSLKGVRFITVKVPGPDPILTQALEAFGFYVTDNTVSLVLHDGRAQPEPELPPGFNFSGKTEDSEGASRVFGRLFDDGRFHNDARIPRETADRLWQSAVLNQILGQSRDLLFLNRDYEPVGFTAIKPVPSPRPDEEGEAGCLFFLGLKHEYRGLGLGRALLDETIRRVRGRYTCLEVETSTFNRPALGLYLSSGFRAEQYKLSLHWWRCG